MIVTREMLEGREAATLAPYACWAARSRGRLYPEAESLHRTCFQKDRDRVIHTTAFRRLEYKTQVFVNYQGDYYRTRLTHTLEVVQVGKSIARALGLNEDLTETIALAHDLGHPPFGHAGEHTLNRLAEAAGGFDHNRQSLRVVTKLERRYPEFPGLNLTHETLEGIAKHETDYDVPNTGWEPGRPSLEAQVVNVADEFAYSAHDLDDGLRSGHLTPQQIVAVPLLSRLLEQLAIDPHRFTDQHRYLLIRKLLGEIITDCIHNSGAALTAAGIATLHDVREHPRTLVGSSAAMAAQLRELKDFLYQNLYCHYRLIRMTRKADHLLERLFEAYLASPEMLPGEIRANAEERGLRRAVIDYLAGMTDRYAGDEYRRLFDPHTLT
ncbi:MAG: deoxyguanosinetriphosphate triphosphohydrolase [Truepera sp.]|nr:deoxyguanosinetriphosphate triphosphohydrolase [Truepera sp.]